MTASQILIIDGDLASRSYLASTLQHEGYFVLQAASGREGLIAAWRDRPDLIIIDPALTDLTGEELAVRLRSDQRTTKVPLIALSSDPQPARLRSCLEAGFNEYKVKAGSSVPLLVETVKSLLGGGLAATAKVGGHMIAFLSAKGGTGTSSLCANVSMNIAARRPEARLAVVDLVLPIGSIAGIVGYSGDQNLITVSQLSAAATTPEFMHANLALIKSWHFHLLAGSPDPERSNALVAGRIGEIISALKSAYDFVVLDLGRSLSRIALPLIEEADLIAMVTATDLGSVNLTKTVWDYLQAKGVQAASVFVILNRAVGLEGVTKPEAEKIIGIPIRTIIPYLGGNFSMANNQHQPYSIKFPGDTASIVLKDTAQQMMDVISRLRGG